MEGRGFSLARRWEPVVNLQVKSYGDGLHGSRCFGRGHVNVQVKFYMEVDVSGGGMLMARCTSKFLHRLPASRKRTSKRLMSTL